MLQEEVGNHDGVFTPQKDDKEWIPAFAGMTDQGMDSRLRGESTPQKRPSVHPSH